jgi:squalene-hopene/tetraprenyl-beta-curcumene cyclase
MKIRVFMIWMLSGGLLAGISLWQALPVAGATKDNPKDGWSRQSAAKYLDDREIWWQNWPRAQKDQGTVCVSCHTQLPYAMARPVLQRELGETGMTPADKVMMDSVEKRVSHWSEMIPFYSDEKSGPGKTVEAHATEAVLNSVILASYDTVQGHLRPVTRTAFGNLWALQQDKGDWEGAWIWQNFHLGPWEGEESGYQGAALIMATALNVPDGYAKQPEVVAHLDRLGEFLRRGYASQPVMNQLYVLWASGKAPGLLTPSERQTLLATLQDQQQADGGWNTTNMDERDRKDDSPAPTESDGYATGIAILAMEQAGIPRHDPMLHRGLDWLVTHQQKDGTWNAVSINKKRDPASDPGLFMQDAATAYAVLALENRK